MYTYMFIFKKIRIHFEIYIVYIIKYSKKRMIKNEKQKWAYKNIVKKILCQRGITKYKRHGVCGG